MKKNYFNKINLLHFNRFVYQETYIPSGIMSSDEDNQKLSESTNEGKEKEETVDNPDTEKQDTKKEIKLKQDEIERNKIRAKTMKLLDKLKQNPNFYSEKSYAKELHKETYDLLQKSVRLENTSGENKGEDETNRLNNYNAHIETFFENEKREITTERSETIPQLTKDINNYLTAAQRYNNTKPYILETHEPIVLDKIFNIISKYMPFKGIYSLSFVEKIIGNYKYDFTIDINAYKVPEIVAISTFIDTTSVEIAAAQTPNTSDNTDTTDKSPDQSTEINKLQGKIDQKINDAITHFKGIHVEQRHIGALYKTLNDFLNKGLISGELSSEEKSLIPNLMLTNKNIQDGFNLYNVTFSFANNGFDINIEQQENNLASTELKELQGKIDKRINDAITHFNDEPFSNKTENTFRTTLSNYLDINNLFTEKEKSQFNNFNHYFSGTLNFYRPYLKGKEELISYQARQIGTPTPYIIYFNHNGTFSLKTNPKETKKKVSPTQTSRDFYIYT